MIHAQCARPWLVDAHSTGQVGTWPAVPEQASRQAGRLRCCLAAPAVCRHFMASTPSGARPGHAPRPAGATSRRRHAVRLHQCRVPGAGGGGGTDAGCGGGLCSWLPGQYAAAGPELHGGFRWAGARGLLPPLSLRRWPEWGAHGFAAHARVVGRPCWTDRLCKGEGTRRPPPTRVPLRAP